MKYIPLILFWCFSSVVYGQHQGVLFQKVSLKMAKILAQEKDQYIFVDTYADWCKPCKRMAKIFQEPGLASYLNANFVNLKVDMNSTQGQYFHSYYEVVFLPTILILDYNGNVKYKHNGVVTSDELLDMLKFVKDGKTIPATPQTSTKTNHIKPYVSSTSEEKIIFQVDKKDSNKDAKFLYHYAYLTMRLDDEDSEKAALEYLETQDNWLSEKNVKFIFDFIDRIDSPLFKHMIQNKNTYKLILGKEIVNNNIDFLVSSHLNQVNYPISVDSVASILAFRNMSTARENAYKHLMNQYETKQLFDNYIDVALEYLNTYPTDYTTMTKVANYSALSKLNHDYSKLIKSLESKVEKQGEKKPELFETLAMLYLKVGKYKRAKKAIKKAIVYSKNIGRSTKNAKAIRERIQDAL